MTNGTGGENLFLDTDIPPERRRDKEPAQSEALTGAKTQVQRGWNQYEMELKMGDNPVHIPYSPKLQSKVNEGKISPEFARLSSLLPEKAQREAFWVKYMKNGNAKEAFHDGDNLQIGRMLKMVESLFSGNPKKSAAFESWLIQAQKKENGVTSYSPPKKARNNGSLQDLDFVTPSPQSPVRGSESLGENGKRVLDAIQKMLGKSAEHCWAWLMAVYNSAGVKPNEIYADPKYKKNANKKNPAELCGMLEPGDWIYCHNGNKSDNYGDHSCVFIGWEDRAKGIAKTASASAKIPGRIDPRPRNLLDQQPITRIFKPV